MTSDKKMLCGASDIKHEQDRRAGRRYESQQERNGLNQIKSARVLLVIKREKGQQIHAKFECPEKLLVPPSTHRIIGWWTDEVQRFYLITCLSVSTNHHPCDNIDGQTNWIISRGIDLAGREIAARGWWLDSKPLHVARGRRTSLQEEVLER
jgi:hypothetical protein